MPTSLTFEEHGQGIGDAWTVLRDNAARAGLDAAVPTCPGWTVRQLVAHQGRIHRWASGIVRGGGPDQDIEAVEQEGLSSSDPLGWLDDGVRDLLATLAAAPADVDAWFFLHDAPPPRDAWARRQCHETTIHAVDAMSAAHGEVPKAVDTWIHAALAEDGIDELLAGFLPRKRYAAKYSAPGLVVVRTTDTGTAWTIAKDGDSSVDVRPGEPGDAPAVELQGTAAQVYLGLWNRGDEMACSDMAFLDHWRGQVRVG